MVEVLRELCGVPVWMEAKPLDLQPGPEGRVIIKLPSAGDLSAPDALDLVDSMKIRLDGRISQAVRLLTLYKAKEQPEGVLTVEALFRR